MILINLKLIKEITITKMGSYSDASRTEVSG